MCQFFFTIVNFVPQHDISRIAALLHRAAELQQPPTLKETKYLLPKPALAARDVKPGQWVGLVSGHWDSVRGMSAGQAKAKVLGQYMR